MIILKATERGRDSMGSGEFGAPRGQRKHNGIDYLAQRGQEVLSHVSGRVTKLGYPYGDDLSFRYVEVTSQDGARHRFFYVEPLVKEGDLIFKTDVLGRAQDLTFRYPGIKNHIHYEVILDGDYINPKEVNFGTNP